MLAKYQSKSMGQSAYHSRNNTESHDISDPECKEPHSSHSVIIGIHKDSKHLQGQQRPNGQFAIKLAPKVPLYQSSDDMQNQISFNSVGTSEINVEKNKMGESHSHHSDSLSKANLVVSSVISLVYVLHTVYWEYIQSKHTYGNTYQHLEISLAMCLFNLIPSLTMLMDLYSIVLSMAVLMHLSWMVYHTLTVWAVDLCYGAIDGGCDAIMLYRNITLCLQAVVASHQILLMLTGCYQNQIKKETIRIDSILEKASNLDIESETQTETQSQTSDFDCNFSDCDSISKENKPNVLQSYPIHQNIRHNQIGIQSQTQTTVATTEATTVATTNILDNKEEEMISESAAEEIEIDEVIQRNLERSALGAATSEMYQNKSNVLCHSVPLKLLKSRLSRVENMDKNKINGNKTEAYSNGNDVCDTQESSHMSGCDKTNEMESDIDGSTFEMYGIGTPKETHGKKLDKPQGLRLVIV